jgi:hypothetical protein
MSKSLLSLGFASALGIAAILAAAPTAQALVLDFTTVFKATAVSANFSYDGVAPAGNYTASGTNSLGQSFTSQGVVEYAIGTTPCTVTRLDGTTETGVDLVLVGNNEAISFPNGFLFDEGTSASGCIGADGAFSGEVNDTIVGGTGAYKGATGTLVPHFSGTTLTEPLPGSFFQAFEGKATYHIHLPLP